MDCSFGSRCELDKEMDLLSLWWIAQRVFGVVTSFLGTWLVLVGEGLLLLVGAQVICNSKAKKIYHSIRSGRDKIE